MYNEQEFVNGNINTNRGPDFDSLRPQTPFRLNFVHQGPKQKINQFVLESQAVSIILYLNKKTVIFDEGTTEK